MMKFLRKAIAMCVLFLLLMGVVRGQEANKIPIKAIVKTADGSPISGATINALGTDVLIISNQSGEFAIELPANATFTVKAPGYKSLVLTATSNINQVILAKEDRLIDVGFRTVEESALPAGVSTVNITRLMEKNYTTYGLEGMEAFAPGFNGNNLWGMNTSLVLIDGVPREVGSLTPNEIEEITFLKSASAVALYGSRGAKGVILIKTKRGTEGKQRINIRSNYGLNVPFGFSQYLGSSEYMTLYNEALANDGLAPNFTPQTIYNHSGVNPYRYPNVDYYSSDYIKNNYSRYDAIAEISGGNERAKYYTNVGYVSNGSLLNFGEAQKNNTSDRFNIRGNVNVQLTKALKARIDASAIFSNSGGVNTDYWAGAATLRPHLFTPLIPINMIEENDDVSKAMIRNATIIDGQYILGGTQIDQTNPIAAIYAGGNNRFVRREFQFTTGVDADLKGILQGLSFSSTLGVDYINSYNQGYRNGYATYQPTWTTYNGQTKIASLTRFGEDMKTGVQNIADSYYRQTISLSGQLNYQTKINQVHGISAVLLAAAYRQSQSQIYQPVTNSNLGLQLNYDFKNKYFVELTGAVVRSPKMPEKNRIAFSPAVSLGWKISEENFLKGSSVLNDLTLTASAGILHTDLDFEEYFAYESIYTGVGGNYYGWADGTGTQSTDSRRGANMDLRLAKREEVSLGLKGAMFNNQFTFGANVFRNRMTGIIGQINVLYPNYFTTGFPSSSFVPFSNYNSDQRTGLDFYLNYNKRVGEVDWTIGASATYYDTKAVKRADYLMYENQYQYRSGKPLDAIWGLRSNGFFANAAEVARANGIDGPKPAFGSGLAPGDIKYFDQNGDNIIDEKDEVYLGRGGWFGAPFTAGLNLSAKYKNFTLFVLGTGRFGGSAMKNNNYFWVNGTDKYSDVVRDRWTPQTQATATFPRLTTLSGDNNFRSSDFWVYSTDRFDLSKVQLSYSFSEKLFANSKVFKELGLYVAGFNLLTVAKEKEILELNVGGAPRTRLYNLGVKARF